MSARAIVTRYGNEQTNLAGDFQIDAYFLITDPVKQGTGAGLDARVLLATSIQLPAATPATWASAIENAVIAEAVANGFVDLVAATTFIPTIA